MQFPDEKASAVVRQATSGIENISACAAVKQPHVSISGPMLKILNHNCHMDRSSCIRSQMETLAALFWNERGLLKGTLEVISVTTAQFEIV